MIKLPLKLAALLLAAIAAAVLWQQAQLSVLALTRIDPLPDTRTMMDEQRYAEAADHLGFFMAYDYVRDDPGAQALTQEIETRRASFRYQAGKLAEGVTTGTSDEAIGQTAGVVTDFLVIGDVRDLALQGIRLAKGEETDGVVVALSTIGLIATGAQLASGGATAATAGAAAPSVAATTAAKSGIVALKAARKLGKLPPWLGRAIIEAARATRQSRSLAAIADILGDANTLLKVRGGFKLLARTTDAASLKRMASFTETFGPKSATLYRIGGDLVTGTASRAGTLGKNMIELAATYGRGGLRALDKVGAIRFVKFSARASKVGYKGDALRLAARALIGIPAWLLYAVIGLGAAGWVPWNALSRRAGARGLCMPGPTRSPKSAERILAARRHHECANVRACEPSAAKPATCSLTLAALRCRR